MHPNFWDNSLIAKKTTEELNELKDDLKELDYFLKEFNVIKNYFEEIYSIKDSEEKELFQKDISDRVDVFDTRLKKEEIKVFFSGKYDKNNAIISIYSGAGGFDAQDWTSMLLKMYKKYAEKRKWGIKILHHHQGEESGTEGVVTKNVTFEVSGRYAYGYLKKEAGVHRLVRVSPFSSQDLRHTSFAYIEVMPEIEEISDIDIIQDDVEVDVFRSSGPGGQNVNKRDTAVRIRHKPTDIVVACQSERNQAANKEKALKILASRLVEEMEKQKKKEISELKGKKIEIEWGSQIRSYVLHPYKMVKDHRTNTETSQVDKVLDGEIDGFIEAEIRQLN